MQYLNLSVRGKRADLKTGVSRKQSTPKLPKNKHFLPPDTHTHVCVSCVSGSKKCLFFGNFGVLCFLETPVLRFVLLPCYRRSRLFVDNYLQKKNKKLYLCVDVLWVYLCVDVISQLVGKKAKGRISKRVFQESKASQNFVSGGKDVCFSEI